MKKMSNNLNRILKPVLPFLAVLQFAGWNSIPLN